jgi:hypothetical protein
VTCKFILHVSRWVRSLMVPAAAPAMHSLDGPCSSGVLTYSSRSTYCCARGPRARNRAWHVHVL